MAATVKDLSKKTGLSVGTISNYLNGRNIKSENKRLIEEAITLLDFNMNYTARSLRTSKSNIIGLVIPSMSVTFFSKVTTIIDQILSKKNYMLMICTLDEADPKQQVEKLTRLKESNIDGFIVIPGTENAVLAQWLEKIQKDKPVIILDKKIESIQKANYVLVNNYEATYEAATYVLGQGHCDIGIITGEQNNYASRERFNGLIQSLEDSDMRVNTYTVEGDFFKESGYTGCKEILEKKPGTTLLFVLNYDMTLGAIEYLNSQNIHIGKDISIIGYDMLELSYVIKPSIAMVAQPLEEMAEYTANLLIEAVEAQENILYDAPREKMFPCTLYANNSVQKMK